MKKMTNVASALAIASSAMVSTSSAWADVSYNIGWASEYFFRGILQKSSSASAGIDFSESGFYAGAWTADVGDGLEVDGYFGYGFETGEGLSGSIGYTGYYYTGEFDDTYQEINLNLSYQMFNLEYSSGEWDGFGSPADYNFMAATMEHAGFHAKYGRHGDEFDGDYLEFGYGTTLGEINVGIMAVLNSEELSDEVDSNGQPARGEAVIFTLSKTWSV